MNPNASHTHEKRVWIRAKPTYWVECVVAGLFRILAPAAVIVACGWGIVVFVVVGTTGHPFDLQKFGCFAGSIAGTYLAFLSFNWLARGFWTTLNKIWMPESEWTRLIEVHNNWVTEYDKAKAEGRRPPVRPY